MAIKTIFVQNFRCLMKKETSINMQYKTKKLNKKNI